MYTFDGPNSLIILDAGVTTLDVADLYSRWKDWVLDSDNSKYEPAFSNSVGGNPLGGGVNLGQYFFLQNGWRIRPQEASHTLTVNGNLFAIPDTFDFFAPTLGNFNVKIRLSSSSLTQQLETGTSGLTSQESTQLAAVDAIQTLVEEIHRLRGLDAANPVTHTPNQIVAGDIEIELTGDGISSSTSTRQP